MFIRALLFIRSYLALLFMRPNLLDRFYDAMYTNCTITNSTLRVEGWVLFRKEKA